MHSFTMQCSSTLCMWPCVLWHTVVNTHNFAAEQPTHDPDAHTVPHDTHLVIARNCSLLYAGQLVPRVLQCSLARRQLKFQSIDLRGTEIACERQQHQSLLANSSTSHCLQTAAPVIACKQQHQALLQSSTSHTSHCWQTAAPGIACKQQHQALLANSSTRHCLQTAAPGIACKQQHQALLANSSTRHCLQTAAPGIACKQQHQALLANSSTSHCCTIHCDILARGDTLTCSNKVRQTTPW